ncbi:MAG: efflux RND transporter permease subunit [Bacteroidetes bacterium]|nr:efflux RND transporter permease subunit [Bacteroidota bacterium]
MINYFIAWSVKNRFIVLFIAVVIAAYGIFSVKNTPVDAIPDLSENQVIIFTEWMGRSPQIIEDQITYPLVSNLQGIPRVKNIRAASMFGMSFVFVIFNDDVDIYWARTRVLERLNYAQRLLPEGITPTLGPDGTGLGHIFWYTLDAPGYDLGELRALQDWYVRFALQTVDGVSEVASFGGFQKQYQVVVDPYKLRYYNIPLMDVVNKIKANNNDVGGRKFEQSDIGYIIRGLGYIKNINEIENIPLKTLNTVPIRVKDVAKVQTGGELRLGIVDENGDGEKVGGIVVMRYGENAKDVIDRLKEKIKDVEKGLPEGVKFKVAYDRSVLIDETIDTLSEAVTEEIIIVCIVLFIFLLHVRSALIVVITIPMSVLIAFILMKWFGITSNIMSLAGVALAVGDLVDAGIVMVENAMKELAEERGSAEIKLSEIDRKKRIEISSKLIGKAVFNSILITLVSFSPILFLEGQEHKLFSPLVWTKTFAMLGSAFVAIFLIPVLMIFFLKGEIRPESKHPVSRFFIWIYTPIIRWCLKWKKTTIVLSVALILGSIPLVLNLGTEFMPPLDEGSLLFMPVTMPDISNSEVKRIMQVQDKLILSVPEVENVLGKAGRANTATDNAPMSMIETIILLKPRDQWRKGKTKNDIINELNSKMQIPGVINGWTQPIINRINMLSTGIRTDVGIKIYGQNLDTINKLAQQFKKELTGLEGIKDLYVEPIVGGKYIDVVIKKEEIGRYGLSVDDVNMFIETALGGMNVTTTIEGRERFTVNIRFAQDYRDQIRKFKDLQIQAMDFGPIPLSAVAEIKISEGPPMINSENAMLRGTLLFNVRERDMGSTVADAKTKLEPFIKKLPKGYFLDWSGQYENQVRAQNRLMFIIPIVLLIIMIILYFTFKNIREVLIVLSAVPVALVGGVYSLHFFGVNFSVAVAVGFIALFGIAVETGVLMLVYMNNSVFKKSEKNKEENKSMTKQGIEDAIYEGAALRLRPKLMTVLVDIIGLMPILIATGTGSDVMKPITIPFVFGLITSTLFVLIVLPVVYAIVREYELRKHGELKIQEFED